LKEAAGNLPASVREQLLNLATKRKEDFGLVLSRYALERLLYRLSASAHRDSFVLKGALLLQVWAGGTYRPTRDLDLLAKGMANLSYQKIFSDVCSQDVEDDGLSFP
jgi:predicted nucleotidyltransferase component of viral defense system